MKFIVYTIEDTKASTFSEPFVQRPGAVCRTLRQMFAKSPLSPNEFYLHEIGFFDNESGELVADTSKFLGLVSDILESDQLKEVDK